MVGLGRASATAASSPPSASPPPRRCCGTTSLTAKRFGIEPWAIKAVATAAARRATNAATFFERVQRELGLRVRIVTGEEEAEAHLARRPARSVPRPPLLVVDLGGGSTELVLGERDRVFHRVSLEIGSVRLTEAFLCGGRRGARSLRSRASSRSSATGWRCQVEKVKLDPLPRTVVGVAGTVTTLTAMQLGLERYDGARVHGSVLERVDLARWTDSSWPPTPGTARQLAAVSPERADWLLAGAMILDRVLAAAERPSLVASDRGSAFGLLS